MAGGAERRTSVPPFQAKLPGKAEMAEATWMCTDGTNGPLGFQDFGLVNVIPLLPFFRPEPLYV